MAGVGTGTIARYNRVMNSDDEELKKKVLADEVKINTAYGIGYIPLTNNKSNKRNSYRICTGYDNDDKPIIKELEIPDNEIIQFMKG